MMGMNRKCSKWTTVVMLACVCGLASCRTGYEVTKVEGARVAMDAAWDTEPMPEAVALLEPYRLGMDSLMGQVKGVAAVSMDRYRPESPLSNLVADVLREAASSVLGRPADMGLVNIGGIRNVLTKGNITTRTIYEILPFNEENKKEVLTEIHLLVRSNAIGIPLLAVIQGMIASLGYYLFDAPSVLLFGFLTCFATIIPIVGTALVWIPLAAYMAISGDWPHALGLVLYCGLIVTNIDNLIRFILQKKLADTHPLITIFGVFIGLPLFGFMGIIFGPLLLSVFLVCVNIFKNQYLR